MLRIAQELRAGTDHLPVTAAKQTSFLAGTTVTDVALRYGFANPGRFAGQYRRAFGVSPAETLRKAKP